MEINSTEELIEYSKKLVSRRINAMNNEIERIIKQIIVEEDCRPSDVVITVLGNVKYQFSVKKGEYDFDIVEYVDMQYKDR